MVFAVVTLAAVLLVCAARLFLIKQDLKRMCVQQQAMQNTDTNAQFTTATHDADVCALADGLNTMLIRHKAQTMEHRSAEANMRQALTNISHDLRTPLTSALGYLQLMEAAGISDEKRGEYAAIVQAKLKMLSALTEHLFAYSRIFERQNLRLEKVNICNVLRDVLAGFYDDFVQKGFDVQLSIPETPVYILGEEEAFRRIFQNLIQNALVHGSRKFTIALNEKAGEIVFSNCAEGIPAMDVSHIFDRFYTFDAARTKKHTGLGLAIVKALVEAMGLGVSASAEGDVLYIRISLR